MHMPCMLCISIFVTKFPQGFAPEGGGGASGVIP